MPDPSVTAVDQAIESTAADALSNVRAHTAGGPYIGANLDPNPYPSLVEAVVAPLQQTTAVLDRAASIVVGARRIWRSGRPASAPSKPAHSPRRQLVDEDWRHSDAAVKQLLTTASRTHSRSRRAMSHRPTRRARRSSRSTRSTRKRSPPR